MIITIDGPAGAGKSTVARALARRLGFRFLDTGAMYRAVALAGLRQAIDWDRPDQLVQLAQGLRINVVGERIFLDGEDVTEEIRTSEVTAVTRHVADNRQVRALLVQLQREVAAADDFVSDGRDQGTVVFPQAECKVFLTADPRERARRRLCDLRGKGESARLEEVLAAQGRRDSEDESRPIGGLLPAADAVEVCTDGLTVEQVVDRLEALVKEQVKR